MCNKAEEYEYKIIHCFIKSENRREKKPSSLILGAKITITQLIAII